MGEKFYENGDIHWNTYSGVFKAYDKEGNEVTFPTKDTSYKIDFDKTLLIENAETIYEGDDVVGIKLKIKNQEKPIVVKCEDLYTTEEDKIEEIAKSYPYPKTWQECEEIAKLLNPNYMNISEKFYCVIQDLQDYIQCNHLENDKELNWIVQQLDEIKEQYENSRNNTDANN